MIMIEVYTRKAFPNASDDFIRGAVWVAQKVVYEIAHNRQPTAKEDIEAILKYENSLPDLIAAEKESFEFNRGASWGFEGYILQLVKGEALNYEEKLIALGGFTADYIETEEYALRMFKSSPENKYNQHAIDYLKKEIAWAKEIEANKTWK
ncbi:hypothetical protein L6468_05915 [Prevotella communis]|uniref:hypothetical protein n=1 Tax=Prevotella communis TaxID=2913614 RepID=UPI001EDC80C9|nr:hypothetical protein [Prevotella communis]UKK63294.1 hypothetical protein L6468_05915 [Prevotella communis]UKK66119.1 hypothetical protein L6473_05915 [Prevotella communis]